MPRNRNRHELLLTDMASHLSKPLQEMISLHIANFAPEENKAREREAEKLLEIIQLSKTEREIQLRIGRLQQAEKISPQKPR